MKKKGGYKALPAFEEDWML